MANQLIVEDSMEKLRSMIFADYIEKTPSSSSMFNRAKQFMPGGVSGNLRFFAPYPLYMASGQGSKTYDVDGNEFIDCFSMNGPLLLGHNHPAQLEALEKMKGKGFLLLNPEIMVECAELITKVIPCAERVRFLNTGTEAVMSAVRIARGYTRKTKILKFFGHYHGQQDQFLFGMGTTRAIFSDGVPNDSAASTLANVYGDIDNVAKVLTEDSDIAAVILDPAMHAGGLWGSKQEDLEALRVLTQKHAVLLIFDEVITGFRLALGGAQEYFGVTPDLVTMAKATGGGEKIAFVAGSADVMSVVDPLAPNTTPRVFQSGTVNDGAIALAVTKATIETYQDLNAKGGYQRLESLALRLKKGMSEAFSRHGMFCQVNQLASMLQLFIAPHPVTFETCQGLNMTAVELFYHALINEGILLSLPTSNHIYLSFAHTDADIALILEKVEVVLTKYDFCGAIN
jgi:glutamate-1-semialdehyde 2,1-aminomutase